MEFRPPVPPPGLSAYLAPGPSSFTDFVTANAPHLLPGRVPEAAAGRGPVVAAGLNTPHATTIVALVFREGVLIAGDRRATAGNMIAQRDIEKVFITDSYSAVGIAGAAGIAVQMVRLYTVELEHYEKMEGVPLSLDGKTNKLAAWSRATWGRPAGLRRRAAVRRLRHRRRSGQGGSDRHLRRHRRPLRRVAGYHSVGSGSVFAKSSLKKLHRTDADLPTTIRNAVEALYDAADDDTATGGPDLTRGIYPVVVSITGAEGAVRHLDEEIEVVVREVVAARTENPGA